MNKICKGVQFLRVSRNFDRKYRGIKKNVQKRPTGKSQDLFQLYILQKKTKRI